VSRVWPSLVGALALAMPSVPAVAGGISVAVCGLPGQSITIPFNTPPPMAPDHGCCKGACHAGCERKSQRFGRGDKGPPDGDSKSHDDD
jgi:hypothetical protein